MNESKHWLTRKSSVRAIWIIFSIILLGTILVNLRIHAHGHFGVDGSLGFYAWYGFGTCVAMIVVAKLLSFFIKREDSYYDD